MEAAGVEGSKNFAALRGGAWTLIVVRLAFWRDRTKMHLNEKFLSRPVPSSEGGGGGVARCERDDRTRWIRPRGNFWQKDIGDSPIEQDELEQLYETHCRARGCCMTYRFLLTKRPLSPTIFCTL